MLIKFAIHELKLLLYLCVLAMTHVEHTITGNENGTKAVISNMYPNSEESPIYTICLCTLSSREKNYVQLGCEALPLFYGINNFHWFLYGCPSMLYIDHDYKPLMVIVNLV